MNTDVTASWSSGDQGWVCCWHVILFSVLSIMVVMFASIEFSSFSSLWDSRFLLVISNKLLTFFRIGLFLFSFSCTFVFSYWMWCWTQFPLEWWCLSELNFIYYSTLLNVYPKSPMIGISDVVESSHTPTSDCLEYLICTEDEVYLFLSSDLIFSFECFTMEVVKRIV